MVSLCVFSKSEVIYTFCKSLFTSSDYLLELCTDEAHFRDCVAHYDFILYDGTANGYATVSDYDLSILKAKKQQILFFYTGTIDLALFDGSTPRLVPFPCSGTFLKESVAAMQGIYGTSKIDSDTYQVKQQSVSYISKEIAIPELKSLSNEYSENVQLKHAVATASRSTLPIILQGATGTGKTYIAKVIHQLSSRKNKPFVSINSGSIPPLLGESHLFGSVKGAYTDAVTTHGYFAKAHGGTLFFDEIENLPLGLQEKLLCVLDDGAYTPVGSTEVCKADVRIIVASNISLKEAVASGRFRLDLWNRLSGFVLSVPPLKGRETDIRTLAKLFCDRINMQIDDTALQALVHYSWPGNVRELDYCIRRAGDYARLEGSDSVIRAEHITFLA